MNKSENRIAFLFIIPSLIGMALFFIMPFIASLGYATSDANGVYVGFANFAALFSNDSFQLAAMNTIKFMLIAIPLNIIIPLWFACFLFNNSKNGWLKTIFMSPLMIPSAGVAFFFQSLFMSNGLFGQILGENTDWLQTEYSFHIAVAVFIWKTMGFNLVLALSGLANIPKAYYEWAAIEGLGRKRMFFKITLVYFLPTLFIMVVMSFINSFKIFRELYMLAGSYPNDKIYMLQHYMNNQFTRLNYQNLTTAAFVIALIITVFMIVFFVINQKVETGE